jgi:phosphomannomutase/phosphoglucomutase
VNDVTILNSSTSLTANELPNEVFRNYDIRGFAHSQITPDFAYKLGAALAITLLKQHYSTIYLGRDGRLSSPALAKALGNGLTQYGMNVIDIGTVSTPST